VSEDGSITVSDVGTPQGGVISPLLANIYLHYVLDLWFERGFRKKCSGYARLIRYADDFGVCFRYKVDAERFHILRAAYANIGAARAEPFPSITLTTSAGTSSSQLSDLFGGGSGLWSFIPSVSVPIFDGGAGAAGVRVAEVERDAALAEYEYTIQTAFQEVSDALSEQSNMSELLSARQSLVKANEKIYRLTEASYRKGLESSLSVLTAQRSNYDAQQDMITA